MLELNRLKYSREKFEGYKFRAIAIFKKDEELHRLDIYTTDTDKSNLVDVLVSKTKIGVDFVKIDHWVTKEQDDMESKLLDEWLSEA
jgi:hypothetical protein